MFGRYNSLLKPSLFIAIALLAALSVVLWLRQRSVLRPEVTADSFNFGVARAGGIVRHVFTIHNNGSRRLQISKIQPSCGCTAVGDSGTQLLANSTVDLPVIVHVGDDNANFISNVLVQFSQGPSIVLKIGGTVKRPCPDGIDFGDVRRGSVALDKFRLEPISNKAIVIEKASYDDKMFEVTSKRASDDSRALIVFVSVRGTIPPGPFQSLLVLQTDDGEKTEQRIVLNGRVLDSVEPDPQDLSMGLFSPGESRTVSIRLRSPYNEPLAVKEVKGLGFASMASTRPLPDSHGLELLLRFTAPSSPGLASGSLDIRCTAGGRPVSTTLPVQCLVR
jgi:hypothetical protein